jgi:hypothetical protein
MTNGGMFDFSTLRRHRVADQCVCCGSDALDSNTAILMPFVAHRAFGWEPALIDASWGLRSVPVGMAYTVCRSLQCTKCSLLFSDIRFSDDELARLYQDYRGSEYLVLREMYEPGYSLRNAALAQPIDYGGSIDRFLGPLLPDEPLAILDWGGDSGKNTPCREKARRHDVYDISGASVIPGARSVNREQAMAERYDLVVCSNVLEHVPYPSDLLHAMCRVMTPESLLYIEVPFEEVMRQYGRNAILHKKHWHEHVNFFSQKALRALLGNVGLGLVAIDTEGSITAGLRSSHMIQVACRLA